MNEIGKRIRKVRRYQELTQEQLAELTGLSTAHIGHIERGTRMPSVQALYAICAVLGIKMEYVTAAE